MNNVKRLGQGVLWRFCAVVLLAVASGGSVAAQDSGGQGLGEDKKQNEKQKTRVGRVRGRIKSKIKVKRPRANRPRPHNLKKRPRSRRGRRRNFFILSTRFWLLTASRPG